MFTCALTAGTDIPLRQNKAAKSSTNFFFITFLFSVSPPATASRKQSASPLLEIAWWSGVSITVAGGLQIRVKGSCYRVVGIIAVNLSHAGWCLGIVSVLYF